MKGRATSHTTELMTDNQSSWNTAYVPRRERISIRMVHGKKARARAATTTAAGGPSTTSVATPKVRWNVW